jgi:3'(2'), 5'-bisphosphate nucleotidase
MKDYLSLAIQAAIDAGKAIMEVYSTNFDIEIKGDDSPLTTADKKANAVIMSYLESTPVPIISEENKRIPFYERSKWTQCWIVDPLDGTKEFIKRNGEFTVNIALISEGKPFLGVIYVPVSKTLYFTDHLARASFKLVVKNESMGISEIYETASKITPVSEISDPVKVVGSRSHLNDDTKEFISRLEKDCKVDIVSKGSSLKFCLVAEGEAHVYPRYAPTMEWDTAAGQAICEAVGLSVKEAQTGEPLRYNKENLLNPYFVVSA